MTRTIQVELGPHLKQALIERANGRNLTDLCVSVLAEEFGTEYVETGWVPRTPASPATLTVNLRVSEILHARVRSRAVLLGVSANTLVKDLLKERLEL